MPRLFDAYVIANWTAAEGKKLGEQSLWIAVAKRDVRMRLKVETHNAATRAEGEKLLADILSDLNKRGDRALIGLDVPLGFPVGTAARLNLKDQSWSGLWAFLADNVRGQARQHQQPLSGRGQDEPADDRRGAAVLGRPGQPGPALADHHQARGRRTATSPNSAPPRTPRNRASCSPRPCGRCTARAPSAATP